MALATKQKPVTINYGNIPSLYPSLIEPRILRRPKQAKDFQEKEPQSPPGKLGGLDFSRHFHGWCALSYRCTTCPQRGE